MTYNVVDPSTGSVVGTLVWNVTAPAPAPTPTPAPAPTPGAIVIPWGPSLYTQWFDVAGADVKIFQFTIGKKGSIQQSVTLGNASASNKFDFSISQKAGSFDPDPALNSANVRLGSFGAIIPFSQMNLIQGHTYYFNIRNTKPTAPDSKFRLDMAQ